MHLFKRYWPALMGFVSIYFVWLIPSYLLGADYWDSYAYRFGDHIILALFNAVAFLFIARRILGRISFWELLWSVVLAIFLGLGMLAVPVFLGFWLDPLVKVVQTGEFDYRFIDMYHAGFIFVQFTFLIWICFIVSLRKPSARNILWLLSLYVMTGLFIAIGVLGDAEFRASSLWVQVIGVGAFPVFALFTFGRQIWHVFTIALAQED